MSKLDGDFEIYLTSSFSSPIFFQFLSNQSFKFLKI